MFTITTEAQHKLVRLKLEGMLSPAQVAELYQQEHQAIEEMGCKVGEHLCIVDLTECPLQIQQVASAFQAEIRSPAKARKLAMFSGQALGRMQARRIAKERDDVGLFSTQAEAEAWLYGASPLSEAA